MFQAGELVAGRYRLLEQHPGAAATQRWLATDVVLARPVFVDIGAASDRVGAAARLTHPNLLAIYDTGVEEGLAYVISEHPAGASARALLARHGPLAPAKVGLIGLGVAEALCKLHSAGLTHGSLDLDDIVLTDDGQVRVTGFGQLGASADADPCAADVVHAGNALYELVCGSAPPPEYVPPRQACPGVPPALDRAITAAVEGSLTTASELRGALASVDTSPDDALAAVVREPTPPVGVRVLRRRRRRWPGATAAVMFAAAVAAVALAAAATSGHHGAHRGGSATGAAAVPIVSASAFDPPPGDGVEDDARLPFLLDGNPSTVWSTEIYTTPDFGHLKSGLGVILTLDGMHSIRGITIATPRPGWQGQLYVSSASAKPTTLAAWGTPVASFTLSQANTTIQTSRTRASLVLVWITNLGSTPVGTGGYRVDIGELTVLS